VEQQNVKSIACRFQNHWISSPACVLVLLGASINLTFFWCACMLFGNCFSLANQAMEVTCDHGVYCVGAWYRVYHSMIWKYTMVAWYQQLLLFICFRCPKSDPLSTLELIKEEVVHCICYFPFLPHPAKTYNRIELKKEM